MSMILLPISEYRKVSASLDGIGFNTLFATTVTDGRMPGVIYVDELREPKTYLVAHPYGMSLLLGETDNAEFNRSLADYMMNKGGFRKRPEWLQVHPDSWNPVIAEMLGPGLKRGKSAAMPAGEARKVVDLTRVNFRFNREMFRKYAENLEPLPGTVVRTTAEMFDTMQGQVIPKYFWKDAIHFINDGAGFSQVVSGKAVSTAFSAFVAEGVMEIGIETVAEHRGKGYAELVSRAFVDHCVRNNLEPVWSCRLDNASSHKLARKLGFEETLKIPYYQLVSG